MVRPWSSCGVAAGTWRILPAPSRSLLNLVANVLFGVGITRRVVCFPKRSAPQSMMMTWSGKFCVHERALHTSRIDKPRWVTISVQAIGKSRSSKYGFFNVVALECTRDVVTDTSEGSAIFGEVGQNMQQRDGVGEKNFFQQC